MHPETSNLHTRWIDGDGAEAIMTSAGIIPDPIPAFSVAKRDRQESTSGARSRARGAPRGAVNAVRLEEVVRPRPFPEGQSGAARPERERPAGPTVDQQQVPQTTS
jgi:hypothetical protein